jgi:DNA-binding NarL/FixJ family response regulator
VALCDDHTVVRNGLARILAGQPDLEVVGEAGTAEEAVEVARRTRPDVFVMDLGLPGANGFAATEAVIEASPGTKVVVLTVHDEAAYVRRAFSVGAKGYLVKEAADVELVDAVRAVAAGQRYVHPTLGAALLTPPKTAQAAGPGGELSDREVEVLRLIARGYTQPEIAAELYISARTVESHRAHIHQKLGLRTRAELVAFARRTDVLDEQEPDL